MARRALRGSGLIAATLGAGALLSAVTPTPARLLTLLEEVARHPQSTTDAHGVETIALTVVGALAWATLIWLILSLVLVAATEAPGRIGAVAGVLSGVLIPATGRRVLTAALGATLLATGNAAVVAAAPTPTAAVAAHAGPSRPVPSAVSALDLDWPVSGRGRTTRPPSAAPSAAPPAASSPPVATPSTRPPGTTPPPSVDPPSDDPSAGDRPDGAAREVVVRRGDTLWSIAARALGPAATDEQIARAWPRWWAANHRVIGDDPDLIRPGQRLTPPPTER